MIDQGVQPRLVHYNMLLGACVLDADLAKAERWLFRMQALGVKPDLSTFGAMMDVAAQARKPEEAQRWLDEARKAGHTLDARSFLSVLHALRLARRTGEVEAFFEQMMMEGTQPDIACCNEMIGTFADEGNLRKVEEWLAIVQQGLVLQPDVQTYNEAMSAYASEQPGDAERLMEEMITQNLQPNVRSYTLLTGDGLSGRDPALVARWSKRLRKSGLEVDAAGYTAVIGAWAAAGDAQEAEEWFARMMQEGKAAPQALALLVDALVLSGGDQGLETAEEWVSSCREGGLELSPAVYAALASADVFRGDFEQVEARMQQMEADGLEMNEDSLTALLLSYANARPQQSQLAEQIFKQQMFRGKMEASRKVLEALRAAVGGARCLTLRRELQINTPQEQSSRRENQVPKDKDADFSDVGLGQRRESWMTPIRSKKLAWE